MTKFNEITDSTDRNTKINYVDESWANWRDARHQSLTRITGYLFVLNTGALLASLTYKATITNASILPSICLFSAGILFSVLHATIDYYLCEHGFSKYQNNTKKLFDNELDWEVFIERNNYSSSWDKALHVLGWLGAIAFFSGLVKGVLQI